MADTAVERAADAAVGLGGCCTGANTNPLTPFGYQGLSVEDHATAKSLCVDATKGNWSDTTCDTSNMIGGCKFDKIPPVYIQWYPIGAFPNQDEDQLKAANCAPGYGVWVKP